MKRGAEQLMQLAEWGKHTAESIESDREVAPQRALRMSQILAFTTLEIIKDLEHMDSDEAAFAVAGQMDLKLSIISELLDRYLEAGLRCFAGGAKGIENRKLRQLEQLDEARRMQVAYQEMQRKYPGKTKEQWRALVGELDEFDCSSKTVQRRLKKIQDTPP